MAQIRKNAQSVFLRVTRSTLTDTRSAYPITKTRRTVADTPFLGWVFEIWVTLRTLVWLAVRLTFLVINSDVLNQFLTFLLNWIGVCFQINWIKTYPQVKSWFWIKKFTLNGLLSVRIEFKLFERVFLIPSQFYFDIIIGRTWCKYFGSYDNFFVNRKVIEIKYNIIRFKKLKIYCICWIQKFTKFSIETKVRTI